MCSICARGGSKGIPRKNLVNIYGKPLIYWSIRNAIDSKIINSVWVTSDDDEILSKAQNYGSLIIKRPKNLSNSKTQPHNSEQKNI